ncbi:MAG TPA: DUF6259 domain-containing protein [Oscillospiraceae bacterium]|nr:DUF6259 domain-containing protein [Oscillospiraceae bacterium]HPF55329.1 DUF6259 domain-containing protein [Clostridiales bacterium]HPK36087.1 DUF6259 domain-containing protein [Oscillospiraceae bacterium]HPR76498.1 DUF6259 domain-containing protein [Oscillospiraceae bacterium]
MAFQNQLNFTVSPNGDRLIWSAKDLPLCGRQNTDFWRLMLDDGYRREMTVKSSEQTGCVTVNGNTTTITYDHVIGTDGRRFEVTLTLRIVQNKDALFFESEISNHDAARVNEFQYPYIDLGTVCDEVRENDVLVRPNGLGERIKNPWAALENTHTEYMSADYHEIKSILLYPRPASMSWFGIESAGNFLYIGRHDKLCRSFSMLSAIQPRECSEPRLVSTVCQYPFAAQGETLTCAPVVVSLTKGDWRNGSDIFGAFAGETFFKHAQPPEWVRNMTGWQRIIMRHQFGEKFWNYSDLPRIYREGKESGLDTLLVFGWWKGRFDNNYPIYEADDDLGGEEGLKAAVEEIHRLGGRVILYANGNLIDRKTDFYREQGHDIARIDIDGNEYEEHYRFSNDGTVLSNYGYKTFSSACQATWGWQKQLVNVGKYKLTFNPDALFFDQLGGAAHLCFNENHRHGRRVDMDYTYRSENFLALRELLNPEQALATECTNDLVSAMTDFLHGCDFGNFYRRNKNDRWQDTMFPQMFLRTFPEVIMTNRFVHDCRVDWKKELNHAFIHGFRFDVSIYRGRNSTIADLPEYAAYIKKLIALKDEYREFFYHGRYICETALVVPEGVQYTEYQNSDRRMFAFWNKSSKTTTFNAAGKNIRINPEDVTCVVI